MGQITIPNEKTKIRITFVLRKRTKREK